MKGWLAESGCGVDEAAHAAAAAGGEPVPDEVVVPDEVFPDEVFPDEVFPDEVFPDEVFPDEVFPDEVFPDWVVPDEAVPDEVFPDEVFPDWVVPDWVVPDEAVPDEVFPDEVFPDWVVPDEAPARPTDAGSAGVGAAFSMDTCATGVRLKAPCVVSTANNTGTRPIAGISHHQRQRVADALCLERTTCVRRGCGGVNGPGTCGPTCFAEDVPNPGYRDPGILR
jgi:hypothetical protein